MDGGKGGIEFVFNGYRASVWEDEKVDGINGCTTMQMSLMSLNGIFENGDNGTCHVVLCLHPLP